jgi:hypothetical protein
MSAESNILRYNNIAPADFPKLIKDLENHPNLEALYLSDTKINADQAHKLASKLEKFTKLKILDLTNAKLNNKGGPIIADAIPTSIEILKLNGSFREDGGIQTLARRLHECQKLQELYLLENPIRSTNVSLIKMKLLEIATLKILHISYAGTMEQEHTGSLVLQKMKESDFLIQPYTPEATPSFKAEHSASCFPRSDDLLSQSGYHHDNSAITPTTPLIAEQFEFVEVIQMADS